MKNKMLSVAVSILLYAMVCFSQQKTATYTNLSPNIFASYKQPIGIGILKFEGSTDLHKRLYDELKAQPGIHDKFTIFPYEILEQQKGALGIKGEINPSKSNVLIMLKMNLEIELVVSGSYISSEGFIIRIYKTSDGLQVFTASYINSTNSMGIEDAIKLFSEKKETKYEEKFTSEMVLVEGGWFNMGSNEGYSDESPVHRVYLNSFYIDKYQVTQRAYEKVMGSNPSYYRCPDCPVENVSWHDAIEYAKKVGKRLPTEAEWEYAARGGNKSRGYEYSGSNNLNEVGWYSGNSGSKTHPVGRLKANELGIHDMSGNVWEWCGDWYDVEYYGRSSESNPRGSKNGIDKVLRGGSWNYIDSSCRVSLRNRNQPDDKQNYVGFRCVKDY